MLCAVVLIVPPFKAPLMFNPQYLQNSPVIAFDVVIVSDDAIDPLVILAHVNEPGY